jgi:riboflavin biosynthesis pyrimidine reductase
LSREDPRSDAGPRSLPLEVLFERPGLPGFGLPAALLAAYGGDLGFESPRTIANFVASVDGVVALAAGGESGQIISQHSEADRFVMGLLRACADAVMIGAGTFRKAPSHLWHAAAVYPAGEALFAETRRRLGLAVRPTLVLVTGSGSVDVGQPAAADAIIVTTTASEAKLRARAPSTARLMVFDSDRIPLGDVIARLRSEGVRLLLTEGGPSLFAQLVAEKLLDELFLTSSPALYGRHPDDRRKSLADGIDLAGAGLELLGVRRRESHLFLRYALARPAG